MSGSIEDVVITVTSPGTPVPMLGVSRRIGMLSLMAKRTDGDNVGAVYIGAENVDRGSRQTIRLLPGDYWEPQLERGGTVDCADIFVDADNAGDGVTGVFQGA